MFLHLNVRSNSVIERELLLHMFFAGTLCGVDRIILENRNGVAAPVFLWEMISWIPPGVSSGNNSNRDAPKLTEIDVAGPARTFSTADLLIV